MITLKTPKALLLIAFIIVSLNFTDKEPTSKDIPDLWEKLFNYEARNLPKSALQVADIIYDLAKRENDNQHMIKALVYHIRFTNEIKNDAFPDLIKHTEKELVHYDLIGKSIAQSLLAQMYWQYYQNNRWKIHNKTNIISDSETNIEQWTYQQFAQKTSEKYQLSIKEAKALQNAQNKNYDVILQKGNTPHERPTLYDILINQALDFYKNNESSLDFTGVDFNLNSDSVFYSHKNFINYSFDKLNTSWPQTKTLKLYQEWLKFRVTDSKNTNALFYADLQRLEYIRKISSRVDSDDLYFQSLNQMLKDYTNDTIQAEIKLTQAKYYLNLFDKTITDGPEKNPYSKNKIKAHKLLKTIINPELPEFIVSDAKALIMRIEDQTIALEHEYIATSQQCIPMKINYKNVNNLHYKIYKISNKSVQKNQNRYHQDSFYETLVKTGKIINENSLELPKYNDFLNHTTEFKLSQLPIGMYLISFSPSADFDKKTDKIYYSLLKVSDLAYLQQKNIEGNVTVYVTDRISGKALANIKSQLIHRHYNYRSRETASSLGDTLFSDKNGFITIPKSNKQAHRGFILQITNNGDTLYTSRSNLYFPSEPKPQKTIFLYTDRGIYRPGQTVHYKGIAIETIGGSSPKIISDFDSSVELKDANWKIVSSTKFTTNNYGTFSGSFIIPQGILNGRMTLNTPFGRKYIQVEEYKRPTFTIDIKEPQDQPKLDELVTVVGNVLNFNGTPGSNKTVSYRIIRMPQHHWWWRSNQPEKQVAFGKTQTNEDGSFDINFTAHSGMKKLDSKTLFTFRIEVDVTDLSGESQSTTQHITIGNSPLLLYLNINNSFETEAKKSIEIKIRNKSQQDTKTEVVLEIIKLENPVKPIMTTYWPSVDTNFQNIANCVADIQLLDRNYKEKSKIEAKILSKSLTVSGDSSVQLDMIKQWKPGSYKITISASNKLGQPVKTSRYFTIFDAKAKKLSFPEIFWSLTENEVLEPGEIAEAKIGTSEKLTILYHVVFDNKIIHTEQVSIKNQIKTFKWPVEEAHRGGLTMVFNAIYKGRIYKSIKTIEVPYTNKQLNISYETFRDKVKPGNLENWTIKISGKNGEAISSELMASMYDKSLDEYSPNNWSLNLYSQKFSGNLWTSNSFRLTQSQEVFYKALSLPRLPIKTYDEFLWNSNFNFFNTSLMIRGYTTTGGTVTKSNAEQAVFGTADQSTALEIINDEETDQELGSIVDTELEKAEVQVRENFNETAFFYPNLYTDENGIVSFSFTVPENLTTYHLQTLAHTKDLKIGLSSKNIVAQKELMAEVSAPRFITQGDTIIIPAKIQNLTTNKLSGNITLTLSNPLTNANYNQLIINQTSNTFNCEANSSQIINYTVYIPDTIQSLQYKIVAVSDKHSDGEQKWLPVLSNRVLVTETQPLWVNETEERTFTLEGLKNSESSKTLTQHKLTLEFTTNPTWYAIQALPYLMESNEKCTEKIFNAYYATEISNSIIQQYPLIQSLFNQWQNSGNDEVFLSNLEKNQELKQVLLKQTPWVFDAMTETEQRKKMALLFNENHIKSEQQKALYQLQKMQYNSGAWPWFDGMRESRYVTTYILTGLGKLKQLGLINASDHSNIFSSIRKALLYTDVKMFEEYNKWKQLNPGKDNYYLNSGVANYLYMRSYFSEIGIAKSNTSEIEELKKHAITHWNKLNKYNQAQIALALHHDDKEEIANNIYNSIQEYALTDEELGMYWKENVAGYYWYQSPIEFQSLMIELFTELDSEVETINELKKWLLKHKQTNNWKTTRATADAIFALMQTKTNVVNNQPNIEIKVGKHKITNQNYQKLADPGTGYFKTSWNTGEIIPEMAQVDISRKGEGISWGSIYWQYFEQIDNIKSAESDLKITKRLFKEVITTGGIQLHEITSDEMLEVGNTIVIRLDFETDRQMEFVHLRDMRAASFEPQQVISGYKYGSGISFYQSTHDTSTDFFIEYLPVGSFSIEYRMFVTHAGNYSSGIANIQCMYAPEFNAHSEGVRVKVQGQ